MIIILLLSTVAIFKLTSCKPYTAPDNADRNDNRNIVIKHSSNEQISQRSDKPDPEYHPATNPDDFAKQDSAVISHSNSDGLQLTKRSIYNQKEANKKYEIQEAVLPEVNHEDLTPAEDIVFQPLFQPQSNPYTQHRLRRAAELGEDYSDNLVPVRDFVFRPVFRPHAQRFRRSLGNSDPNTNLEKSDDLLSAEGGMVFRPVFHSHRYPIRSDRARRSVLENDKSNKMYDLDSAEAGLVFRPVFRNRPKGL